MKKMIVSLDALLEHVKQVEEEIISLSKDSFLQLHEVISRNNVALDDKSIEAMQYQDIVSQQLGATIEAIEEARISLKDADISGCECDENVSVVLESLGSKLDDVLVAAQMKHSAFSGKVHNEDESIEFF